MLSRIRISGNGIGGNFGLHIIETDEDRGKKSCFSYDEDGSEILCRKVPVNKRMIGGIKYIRMLYGNKTHILLWCFALYTGIISMVI